jgi:uncharacterized protein YndB with AHSA1/START domain
VTLALATEKKIFFAKQKKFNPENSNFNSLKKNTMANNKVTLHRVFTAPPEKVYKAFTDADAMASWLPPYGFVCKVHNMDFQIGGKYKMSFTNFTTGSSDSFGGEYLEIIPNERLKYTDEFDDPNLPGLMITTIELRKVLCGTELFATQEGIPDAIPTEMCYLGWQESLDKLKRLVEPNIPDA